MIMALARDNVEFVKLLLDYGVSISSFLTNEVLEFLHGYRSVPVWFGLFCFFIVIEFETEIHEFHENKEISLRSQTHRGTTKNLFHIQTSHKAQNFTNFSIDPKKKIHH